MLVQEPIHAAIWHCLNHYAYPSATFLAERLFTEVGSDTALHLLATCYYRSGKLNQAYNILRKHESKTPENRYLLAKCCLDLDQTHEAEIVLLNDVIETKSRDVADDVTFNFQDTACFALQILAKIFSKTERVPKANEADRKALKLNPLLWESFESLCQRGDYIDTNVVFNIEKLDELSHCQGNNHIISYANHAPSNSGASSVFPQGGGPPQPPSNTGPTPTGLNLPQPRASLLATPTYSYNGSSTSTPILPVSNVQAISTGPSLQVPQPVILVTPITQQFGSDSLDSDFTGSPAPGSSRLAMSGVAALNFSSDLEHTTNNVTNPLSENINKAMMPPPPPMKPKLQRRIGGFNDSSTTPSPEMLQERLNYNSSSRAFGRFPRGALVWSSNGKPEPLNNASSLTSLQGSKLDFSPLGVLSPFNPSSPLTGVQKATPLPEGPLNNSTNSDHKVKRNKIENITPAKQPLFGQSSHQINQNTPNSNNNSGSVRRSSRLFVSQQETIKSKENANKTPNPSKVSRNNIKSPSKKSSKSSRPNTRQMANPNAASSENLQPVDKNEKNRMMDFEESENRPPSMDDSVFISQVKDTKEQVTSLQKHSLDGLMFLFRQLGKAYIELSKFKCREAIHQLNQIEPHHKSTPWVMGIMGKAYFEMGEYLTAKKHFQNMRDLDHFRTEFMEYFSTALWHLQDEVELSALAQELTTIGTSQHDKMSPQSWCVAGNCFSLQKEHENAIKFFQRAAQVNPNFAYAYTLLGHEYITIEELDKALSCFRTAVRIDPRHYNAWYGIGLVFYKQERFQLAEIYFHKSVNINSQSPLLMCNLAVVQHALQKTDKALETLNLALKGAPKTPLCKFEKASILFSSERHTEALAELEELKILAPKESPVYFLMGKVHNKLNNTHLALMNFSWAMDLDPKGANSQIKDALDRSMNKAAQENIDIGTSHLDDHVADHGHLHEDEDDDMQEDGSGEEEVGGHLVSVDGLESLDISNGESVSPPRNSSLL